MKTKTKTRKFYYVPSYVRNSLSRYLVDQRDAEAEIGIFQNDNALLVGLASNQCVLDRHGRLFESKRVELCSILHKQMQNYSIE